MSEPHEIVRTTLGDALSGRGAHALTAEIFDGAPWEWAGALPDGSPHSLFQLLNHLVYWQEFALRWLDGAKPEAPEHDVDSWPAGRAPADLDSWESSVERFKAGLAALRRALGTWPPPSGGLTW